MDGRQIDFDRGEEVEARAALEAMLEWTAPAREELRLEVDLPEANGAQRALRAHEDGESIEEIYRSAFERTRRTYVPEGVSAQ
jgi:hypothetical protein